MAPSRAASHASHPDSVNRPLRHCHCSTAGVSDRRRPGRFRLTEAAESNARIYVDVIAEPHGDNEWIATGREPAVPGETLILDIVVLDTDEGELCQRFPVCVIDSRPIILDGDMRHRIRLCRGDLAPVLFEGTIRPR